MRDSNNDGHTFPAAKQSLKPNSVSTEPFQVPNIMVEEITIDFSKIPFLALVKEACGIRPNEVSIFLVSLPHTRARFCRWLSGQSENYGAVDTVRYLKNMEE